MSETIAPGPRPKWALLVVAVVGVVVAGWLLWPRHAEDAAPEVDPDAAAEMPVAQQELRERFEQARAVPPRPEPEEELRTTIAGHQAAIDADPEAEETPGLLNAMANLYLQRLTDYRAAAEAYQRLLIEYPDWEGNYAVFPQLELCYEQLNDGEGLRWLWAQMMDRFPPESELHHYGAQQLGLPPAPPSPPEVLEEEEIIEEPAPPAQ